MTPLKNDQLQEQDASTCIVGSFFSAPKNKGDSGELGHHKVLNYRTTLQNDLDMRISNILNNPIGLSAITINSLRKSASQDADSNRFAKKRYLDIAHKPAI